jgi:hypothetical protein
MVDGAAKDLQELLLGQFSSLIDQDGWFLLFS